MLLLDEPFGALDAKVRQDLRQWLDELHRELGVTSLLVTHDQEEALELANQIVVMHEGRVQQVGAPSEIYDDPKTPFVAGFVGLGQRAARRGRGWPRAPRRLPGRRGGASRGRVGRHGVRPPARRAGAAERLERPRRAMGRRAIGRVERISSLGWLARLTIRLDGEGNHTLVAHVPQSDLAGATEGDLVSVDLRNPKAFDRAEAEAVSQASEVATAE